MAANSDWDAVRSRAAGNAADYARDARPIAAAGQGEVRRAHHKPTSVTVAIKKLLNPRDDAARARMGREITVAHALAENAHVMPVLDANQAEGWFVMPLASHTLAESPQIWATAELRELLDQVAIALEAAHSLDWVHRDIKPANILWLEDRWVLADWGLGRPALGTSENRTRTGVMLGSPGYAAPELEDHPHTATAAADIYSLGQLIGHLLTGRQPKQNVPLLPEDGPWRQIVRACTHRDPTRRPQSIAAFRALLDDELGTPEPAGKLADRLLAKARLSPMTPDVDGGAREAALELWRYAATHPEEDDTLTIVLPQLPTNSVVACTRSDPDDALTIAEALGRLLDYAGDLRFAEAGAVIDLLHTISAGAVQLQRWDLLEMASDALFAWDSRWDQYKQRDRMEPWLLTLAGEAARIVAAALRDHPDSAVHFERIADNRKLDDRIAQSLRHHG